MTLLESVLTDAPQWIDALEVRQYRSTAAQQYSSTAWSRPAALVCRLGPCLLTRLSTSRHTMPHPPTTSMTHSAATQVLGRVYPKAARKAGSAKVVGQFKEAAAQRPSNAELWELLGDLLASLEPAGGLGVEVAVSCVRCSLEGGFSV